MDFLHHDLNKYLASFSSPEDEVLQDLTRETFVKVQMPQMISGHLQGQFLQLMVQLMQCKNVLEIGTFTGYATLCMARGLPTNGKITTIDCNEELATLCHKYWEKAGVSDKIELRIGKALHIIPTLNQKWDLVFIDADKANYSAYFDAVIDQVKSGGLIVADNVLWSGKVLLENKDKDTQIIHAYNEKVLNDSRVENFILPIRDGLNIARKK